MLLGRYESSITGKRRLAVPKQFREQMGDKLIVTRWYEKCLVIVTESGWNSILGKTTSKSDFITTPVRDTDRFIMGSAFEVVPDEQGRVVIPQYLADYAELKGGVIFLGLGDRVEIWDQEVWIEREKYIVANADSILESVVSGNPVTKGEGAGRN